jgi:hypothetical protein
VVLGLVSAEISWQISSHFKQARVLGTTCKTPYPYQLQSLVSKASTAANGLVPHATSDSESDPESGSMSETQVREDVVGDRPCPNWESGYGYRRGFRPRCVSVPRVECHQARR